MNFYHNILVNSAWSSLMSLYQEYYIPIKKKLKLANSSNNVTYLLYLSKAQSIAGRYNIFFNSEYIHF